jgi:hypothetical protein
MGDAYIWTYFLTLAGYITAGFIRGWDTAYLTAGIVFWGLPLVLPAVLIIFFYLGKAIAKKRAKKLLKNLQINVEKIYTPEKSRYRVYHCRVISEKINTRCSITCRADSNEVHSVRLSPKWRKKNEDIYQKYGRTVEEIIADAFKKA